MYARYAKICMLGYILNYFSYNDKIKQLNIFKIFPENRD